MNSFGEIYWVGWAVAMLGVAAALPVWRAVCPRLGLVDFPGARKLHTTNVPLAGGLAVLTGLSVAQMVVLGVSESLRTLFAQNASLWITLWSGAVLMTLVGVMDDRHVLRPSLKLALQLIVALAVSSAGLRITLFVPNLVFQHAVTVLWILTVINAFNFMDNMNGLCAGLGAIAAAVFAATASRHEQHAEAVFSLMVCGALLGFLPYNYPRARAFLGDAGSHLIGFCMAVLAVLPTFHTGQDSHPLAVLKPLLILAVPLMDMAWVVVFRWRAGQRFYVGDTNHLSHRLVRRNLRPPVAVALIWMLALICGGLALL